MSGAVLRLRGWKINNKRVYRLWRALGLALPPYKPSRKIRTGVKLDGPAMTRNHVWAITPGKPWPNGSNESFNGTLRRECLDAELFGSLMEAQVVIARWRDT